MIRTFAYRQTDKQYRSRNRPRKTPSTVAFETAIDRSRATRAFRLPRRRVDSAAAPRHADARPPRAIARRARDATRRVKNSRFSRARVNAGARRARRGDALSGTESRRRTARATPSDRLGRVKAVVRDARDARARTRTRASRGKKTDRSIRRAGGRGGGARADARRE